MNKIVTALALAASMLAVAGLGSLGLISADMSSTLLIVLPALWVASQGSKCSLLRRRSAAE